MSDAILIPHNSTGDLLDRTGPFASVLIDTYWSGKIAPPARAMTADLSWSDDHFCVRFITSRDEPLVVSPNPRTNTKTLGLWEHDVCEIFIAPDPSTPNRYFEFEIAPTGEWLDLALEIKDGERFTDWEYASGMRSAAAIRQGRVWLSIQVPFLSLGRSPKSGDVWLGNLFRCVGKDADRGYLAWQPTRTPEPDFHVPERFGEMVFV